MFSRTFWMILGIVLLAIVGAAVGMWWSDGNMPNLVRRETYEVEKTDYHPPPAPEEDVLVDDKLEDKQPGFDPTLVDRRPLGEKDSWLLNASAAVIRLDVPMILPDKEPNFLQLYPSYAAAVQASAHAPILPSVNLVDGKAKEFDDGLYAALDQAYYQGLKNHLLSHVELVRRFYDKVDKDSAAAPFLAAGLELAGVHVEVADKAAAQRWLSDFRADETASKPIGFYTWNEDLSACFRFLRFFQKQFDTDHLQVPFALAAALSQDMRLFADYSKALHFYAQLTNPYICLSVADVMKVPPPDAARLAALFQNKKVSHKTIAFFPSSTSRETVLFEKLFPGGLPPNVDLMRELVRRIRSGEVDLRPNPDSGWYEFQVYALETLLLPEKGQERSKLLLTKSYKKRMLEAFQALITKRRETHVRQLAMAEGMSAAPPPDRIEPRLRVEPCPTYYLRTARGYAFLANVLEAAVGREALRKLHGLKQGGERSQDLPAELLGMRDLFYGLYLVSAEDIGLKPEFVKDEKVDQDACYNRAVNWLGTAFQDPDLVADTRVAVPIFVDRPRGVTRLWLTLGVRLTKLDAEYARPPHMKPAKGEADWQLVESSRLGKSEYHIPVDEFAEVEVLGLKVLTREELRAICDREKTKEAIIKALRK